MLTTDKACLHVSRAISFRHLVVSGDTICLTSTVRLAVTHSLPKVRLFDLDIAAATFDQANAALVAAATVRRATGGAHIVVTPNIDHLVRLDHADPAFRAMYARADFIFADGMPVVWASKLLGKPLPARVTGADLFVSLCKSAMAQDLRVLVVGGMPGTEAELIERFAQYYPGLQVDIMCPSMRFDPTGPEGQVAADRARAFDADIIFVCVGMPKQERWAFHHAPALTHGIVLCVGAAMEFALGYKKRAPAWMQKSGTEWLWRLCSDPGRLWRRYLVEDPKFVLLCWREWRKNR
ncbi:MAG: glycosyltransferase [Comamonadaceae bacterium]|nr:MAG: glycosyltransferase [Comamonadaceae bacterium]